VDELVLLESDGGIWKAQPKSQNSFHFQVPSCLLVNCRRVVSNILAISNSTFETSNPDRQYLNTNASKQQTNVELQCQRTPTPTPANTNACEHQCQPEPTPTPVNNTSIA
jgi:hypothetical protein